MFERFTLQAVRAVELARDEAARLDQRLVGPEHLLLGLIREGEGVAARALFSLGVDEAQLRLLVEHATEDVLDGPQDAVPRLGPGAKRVLRLSLLELLPLGQREIGTEAILLAITRDSDSAIDRLLASLGTSREAVRSRVLVFVHGGNVGGQVLANEMAAERRTRRAPALGARPVPVPEVPVARGPHGFPTWLWVTADAAVAVLVAAALPLVEKGLDEPPLPLVWLAASAALWLALVAGAGAYRRTWLGVGFTDFRRILGCGLAVVAIIGLAGFITSTEPPRLPVMLLVASLVGGSWAERAVLRIWLHGRWARGRYLERVLVVGSEHDVLALVRALQAERYHGLTVVGACLPGPGQRPALMERGIPVLGGFDRSRKAARLTDAQTVAVLGHPELGVDEAARMLYELEADGLGVLVAGSLVAALSWGRTAERIPALPLVRVSSSPSTIGRSVAKAVFDRVGALALIIALSPILLGIALAVRREGGGPVMMRYTRVGRRGVPFVMFQFRTMVADAEARREPLGALNESDGPLFKISNDPRITRIGRRLRRRGLDNLPQLFNVLRGSMSLVGPGAMLPEEFNQFSHDSPRLRFRPGMISVSRVSPRRLSWAESAEAERAYNEHWSPATDLRVLWKAARRVTRHRAA